MLPPRRARLPRLCLALYDPSDTIVSLGAGDRFSVARSAKGSCYMWGTLQTAVLPHPQRVPIWEPVSQVGCGAKHVLALTGAPLGAGPTRQRGVTCLPLTTAGGRVASWGCGRSGRLGHGDEAQRLEPQFVRALDGDRPIAVVAAGGMHSLAVSRALRGRPFPEAGARRTL